MMNPQKYRALAFAGLAVTAATGCGQVSNPVAGMVNDVQVKTAQMGNDLWVDLSADLNVGAFGLAGINLPIIDPDSNVQYGSITLVSGSAGAAHLDVQADVTAITHLNLGNGLLPNGTQIPVGGIQNAAVMGIPISNTGAKVYVAFGSGVALVGVALPFQQLDGIGRYVPGTDLMFPVTFGQVKADVGMFFGNQSGQTGLGVFADFSGVLPAGFNAGSASSNGLMASTMSLRGSSSQANVQMMTVRPSSAREQWIYNQLYMLERQRPRLTLKQ